MNDFDFDCKEKKRIARGAFAKKNGSRSKRCTMPDDYLTPAQRKALNGPTRTWKLDEPMLWKDFKEMPEEIQREYLLKLRDHFHASDQAIGDMMGVAYMTVCRCRKSLGISTPGTRNKMSKAQTEAFCNWIERSAVPAPEPDEEPEPAPVSEQTEAITLPASVATVGGSFTVTGPAEDALETLTAFFRGNTRPGTFTVTYTYTYEEAGA